jgi:hypothetical protein
MYPIMIIDPKQDKMSGKRFDGRDLISDEIITYGGDCFCGAKEGIKHHHQKMSEAIPITWEE